MTEFTVTLTGGTRSLNPIGMLKLLRKTTGEGLESAKTRVDQIRSSGTVTVGFRTESDAVAFLEAAREFGVLGKMHSMCTMATADA